METHFEKYLSESLKNFQECAGKSLSPQKVMELFFPKKVAVFTDELLIKKGRRNAIVMAGPSCCGKTTWAREFIENHKDFILISMDKCTAQEIRSLPMNEVKSIYEGKRCVDDYGNGTFGKMIAAGHPNIILDGNWMSITARSALLKALDECGYHIILCVMSPKQDSYDKRVESRVFTIMCSEILGIDLSAAMDGADLVEMCARAVGCSKENLKKILRSQPSFKERLKFQYFMLDQEKEKSDFENQLDTHLIFLGADELVLMEI